MTPPDDTLFEKRFHIQLDDGVVTLPLRVQRWAEKRGDGFGAFVIAFVVPWLKKVWVEVKTKQTMADVDRQTSTLVDAWDSDEEWMMDPAFTEKKDPENPFGVSEMRIKSPWSESSET